MTTIPASQIVSVVPSVLSAGGISLAINGVMLTSSTRVPIGAIQPFSSAALVGDYFGETSLENDIATHYFNAFDNSNIKPANIYFTQYPVTAASAWMRGGTMAGITLQQLQLLSGSLTVIVDNYVFSAPSISLAGAVSWSSAASLIQTGLNASLPTEVVCTGSIGPQVASFTGSIAGHVLTVTAVAGGTLAVGATVAGSGVATGTLITDQLSGAAGGVGTYAVTDGSTVIGGITDTLAGQTTASEAMTCTYGLMTTSVVSSGFIQPGLTVTGSGVTGTPLVTAQLSGTLGGVGTYAITVSQTQTSKTLTLTATALTVSWDSIAGAFVITSGAFGANSTITFATGTLSGSLNFTSARGAVLSQGAETATPSAFLTAVTDITTNWATFMTCFEPDGTSGFNTQKLLFCEWAAASGNRYAFVCWDQDESPATTVPSTESLGYLLQQSNSSGIYLIGNGVGAGEPGGPALASPQHAAFICGTAAAINFNQINGRITFAFRSQSGLTASVIDGASSENLLANGYNFYGAYATASQEFIWEYNGQISGEFLWMDSYINQIWLNAGLQNALMVLLRNNLSIPYNAAGYSLIEAACLDQIKAAVTFGAIRAGVPLSQAQAAEVNSQAGVNVANVIYLQGFYFQVLPASPAVRQVRGSPPCTLWYSDGQSIQQIQLASIELV